jgi:putative DNA primase/helicase
LDFLDTAVAAARRERATTDDGKGHAITFEEVIPAFEQVDGADLADRLIAVFTRFAALPKHGATALTLWTLFTYCLDLFQIAPRLDLSSTEKQCGKTTTLSLLNRLAFRAALSSNISPSAIFRVIARHKPTLLIDEMDTFIEGNEALRGILNSGHTKEAASIIRCEGDDHEPKMFSTWAAMAFAHIGKIPDTLEDRSIRLPMRRKLPSEKVESLRRTGPAAVALHEELSTLPREMMRWIEDHSGAIAMATPSMVEGMSDRASDNWLPLLAIADALGGAWPKKSQEAAASLSGHGTVDNESIKVELLTDIRSIFGGKSVDRLSSADLCNCLALMEDRPWGTWKHGKPMTQVQLARLLKPFGVSSRTIKLEGQGTPRGYLVEDFADAFTRYTSSLPGDFTLSKCNHATTRSQSGDGTVFQGATTGDGCTPRNGLNPAPMAESCAGALQNGVSLGGERCYEENEGEGGRTLYTEFEGEEAINGND